MRGLILGSSQVFKAGNVSQGDTSDESAVIDLSKRRTGPSLNNKIKDRFANVSFGKLIRGKNQSKNFLDKANIDETQPKDNDLSIELNSRVTSALEKHEKERQQNFLHDRLKSIASETQRIEANLSLSSIKH